MDRRWDYRIRKLRLGLCVNCGKNRLITITLCEDCRVKKIECYRKRIARKKIFLNLR